MNDISKRLLELIESKGLSYGELAKITKIPKSALQRYATGVTIKIPLDRINLLASALNTTPAYLMGWEEIKNSSTKTVDEQLSELFSQLNPDNQEKIIELAKMYADSQDKN